MLARLAAATLMAWVIGNASLLLAAQPARPKAPAAAAQPKPAPTRPAARTPPPTVPPAAAAPRTEEIVPESVVAKHRKAVFDAYVQAARASDWKKAAGYFDPQELAELHELMTTILNAAAAKREDAELLKLFGGAPSAAAFAKQSPAETFAGFMGGMTQATPALKDAIATSQFQYLGEVIESDELVHIVYRTRVKVGGIESTKVTASSMTKTPDGWRLLLDAEVEDFAKFLERQVMGPDEPPENPPR